MGEYITSIFHSIIAGIIVELTVNMVCKWLDRR